jgi:hypothetical protein
MTKVSPDRRLGNFYRQVEDASTSGDFTAAKGMKVMDL